MSQHIQCDHTDVFHQRRQLHISNRKRILSQQDRQRFHLFPLPFCQHNIDGVDQLIHHRISLNHYHCHNRSIEPSPLFSTFTPPHVNSSTHLVPHHLNRQYHLSTVVLGMQDKACYFKVRKRTEEVQRPDEHQQEKDAQGM